MTPQTHVPHRSEAGLVYVEFLLCFIPIFVLFLGTVQLALIAGANLVVKHAAYRGARSASVVLADDPRFYDGEPIGHLGTPADNSGPGSGGSGSSGSGGSGFLGGLGLALNIDFAGFSGLSDADDVGARLSDIQMATYAPLAALTPNLQNLKTIAEGSNAANSLAEALDDEHWSRLALGLAAYNDIATVVRFPDARNSDTYYEDDVDTAADDITVRVTHLFRCAIPVVAPLICRSARSLGLDYALDRSTDDGSQDEDSLDEEQEDEPSAEELAEQQLFDDLDHIPSRAGLAALSVSNTHIFVLKQESTIPSQWAPYPYASGDEE